MSVVPYVLAFMFMRFGKYKCDTEVMRFRGWLSICVMLHVMRNDVIILKEMGWVHKIAGSLLSHKHWIPRHTM